MYLTQLQARRLTAAFALVGVFVLSLPSQTWEDFRTPTPISPDKTLVIGFLGGRERWDNDERSPRKLALKLRSRQIPGLHVETLANRKRPLAVTLIERAFDRNRDGVLDPTEGASARIVIYGLSFGGAAAVKLARDLSERNIPVLLTIQIDSVGRDDALIPPNVRRAANFYQTDGLVIRGEGPIRAEDPSRTTIIADCRMDYSKRKIDISHVNWFKKLGRVAHSYISYDPQVWTGVEKLILGEASRESGDHQKLAVPCPPS